MNKKKSSTSVVAKKEEIYHKLNHYNLDVKPLGSGTYSTVYRGYGTSGGTFAIKVFFHDSDILDPKLAVEEARTE